MYVDGILVTGSHKRLIQTIIAFLVTKFKVEDLGSLKYFLGIEVARSKGGIYFHQSKYTLDILKDTGLLAANHLKYLLSKIIIYRIMQVLFNHLLLLVYRRIVGRLLYLTVTRPDISHLVQVLSQFLATPRSDHLEASHKVIRYLKSAPGQGILISTNNPMHMTAYCNFDWVGDKET